MNDQNKNKSKTRYRQKHSRSKSTKKYNTFFLPKRKKNTMTTRSNDDDDGWKTDFTIEAKLLTKLITIAQQTAAEAFVDKLWSCPFNVQYFRYSHFWGGKKKKKNQMCNVAQNLVYSAIV